MLRGAGEAPAALAAGAARIQEFADNLHQQSVTPLGPYSFYGNIRNNHTLMTAAALGMAAVVLSEATSTNPSQQPATWAGTGLFHIDHVLWRDAQRQSDSTQVAGYAEGPYYLKYALLNCLPFFRAMGHFLPDGRLPYAFAGTTRSICNPYYDPKYARLYEWLTAIAMPDGRFPALEDSYVDMGMPELALTGNSRQVTPMYFSKLTGTGMASLTAQLRDLTVDMRAAWLAAAVLPIAPSHPPRAVKFCRCRPPRAPHPKNLTALSHPPLTVLPASGNLVFRSSSDSLASYLHLYDRGGLAKPMPAATARAAPAALCYTPRASCWPLTPAT